MLNFIKKNEKCCNYYNILILIVSKVNELRFYIILNNIFSYDIYKI